METTELSVPPHDEAIERAVLGAAMIADVFVDITELLREEDFYILRHRLIWQAMLSLSKDSIPIDYLTVVERLRMLGQLETVGGGSVVAELMVDIVSAANVKHHAKLIRELATLRALRKIGQTLTLGAAEHQDSQVLSADAERQLFDALWARQTRPWKTSLDVMTEAMAQLDVIQQRGGVMPGITTGLADLDRLLGGWQLNDLIILAGRTSMGKTALACGAAVAAAKAGAQVGIVSLEMGTLQLSTRLLANEARVGVHEILNGQLGAEKLRAVRKSAIRLAELPISYEDSGVLTMDQLRAKARQLRVKGALDLLIVDYLQLLRTGHRTDSRQVEISELSRGLKLLAKELGIAVVALAQVSRKCEERPDKRPILSDLRESGAIEQDADVVVFLYRDEVYDDETPDRGIAEVLVRKHRNGPTGDVRVAFLHDSATFADMTEVQA